MKIKIMRFAAASILVAGTMLMSGNASAGWPSSPLVNVPLCTMTGKQENPVIVADGFGGAIVAWDDGRVQFDEADIYAQRVSADGTSLWMSNGTAICKLGRSQYSPAIASDGSGGAIIAWLDTRDTTYGNVYIQRISAAGQLLWAQDGVPVCTVPGTKVYLAAVSDGAGGAIVTWTDNRSGAYSSDIYAQRFSGEGVALWTNNGIPISTADSFQFHPAIVTDDAGGAIIAWDDQRLSQNADIYVQRVFVDGIPGGMSNAMVESVASLNCFPNPSNPHVTIDFDVPSDCTGSLAVYDLGGRLVRTLVTGGLAKGAQRVVWDRRDSLGHEVASGNYSARLDVGGAIATVGMTLLR